MDSIIDNTNADNANNNPALIFIFFTVLIDMIGVGIIVPIMPDLIMDLTGKNLSEGAFLGGLLIFSYAIVQFVFAPVMGELSDRFGRKPVLLLALLGLGLDYLIHAYSPTIAWLFLGRIIAGIFGASHTVAMAYVADISTKENKAKNFGIMGAAFGLGFVIGPGIGGVVGEAWGVKAPFFVAAAFSLLNFLLGLFLVKESLPLAKRRKVNFAKMIPFSWLGHMSKYKGVLGFILAFALAQFAGMAMPATWSFFTMESYSWNKLDVGISLMVVGLLVSIVQAVLTGFIVKKFGNKIAIIAGFILWTIGMFLIAFAGNVFFLIGASIPYLLGGIAAPTIQGLLSNQVSESEQGNLQGVLTSLQSLSGAIAPLLFTSLFGLYTGRNAIIYFPGAPYFVGALFLLIATVVATLSIRSLVKNEGFDTESPQVVTHDINQEDEII